MTLVKNMILAAWLPLAAVGTLARTHLAVAGLQLGAETGYACPAAGALYAVAGALKSDDTDSPRYFPRRVPPRADFKSKVPPSAPSAAGPVNVLEMGAVGDGIADDSAAIQKAIDLAQNGTSRAVYFPGGHYLVNRSLSVANTRQPVDPKGQALAGSVRLFGDGMRQSAVVAGQPMDAVLRFVGHAPQGSGKPGLTTGGHSVENMAFGAEGLANYSVAAAGITRSQFRYAAFSGARIAGLMLGYGWINDVLECYFEYNLIGLYLDNAVNSVNVLDSNFEENYGVGLIVNSGEMVRIEGNEFESQGGPGIIANKIGALTL
jgi:hypothetical protein